MNRPIAYHSRRVHWRVVAILGIGITTIVCVLIVYFLRARKSDCDVILRRVSVSTNHLKPPQEENVFYLELANFGKRDLWYVWTDRTKKLSHDSYYYKGSTDGPSFTGDISIDCKSLGGNGNIYILNFIGEGTEDRFYAMLLRANSRVVCKQYPFISWGKLDNLTLHVVRSLMVDGNTSLEEWLPYDSGNHGDINLDAEPYAFSSGLYPAEVSWKPGKGVLDVKKLHLSSIEFRPIESYTWRAENNLCERQK